MTRRPRTHSILMTADPIGGVWQYALELCAELNRRSIDVTLACMGRRLTGAERTAVADLTNVEVFESDFKLEWMNEPWSDISRAAQWLLELEQQRQPSLIHLNQYCFGALPWRSPCLVVGHSCVCSWFEAVKGTPPGPEWNRYRETVRHGLQYADAVTAPSRSMLAALERHYGIFRAAVPIYNGRSGAHFAPVEKEPFVLTAGRLWDEAKNVAILQRVAAAISWPIYAAGECATPDGKKQHLEGLHLLGSLDLRALARWFGRAAIFVAPACYEPFGLSILEAALSGCALVLGDIESLHEIWHESALFVPRYDADAIATGLLALIRDPSLRAELSRRSRARALEYTPERMAERYLELYETLIGEDRPHQSFGADGRIL